MAPTLVTARSVVGGTAKAALMAPTSFVRLTEALLSPVAEMRPTLALAVTLPFGSASRIDRAVAVAWTATDEGTRRT
jgi:hypothetical protein